MAQIFQLDRGYLKLASAAPSSSFGVNSGSESVIQDLSGSWRIKGTGESMARVDSSVPLIHHERGRSWITYPEPAPDQPKGMHPNVCRTGIAVVKIL